MKKYNFYTAFTMIIGICIGTGIFFKADDILTITKGNVTIGVLLFVVGALVVIFCGLTMGKIAEKFQSSNGLISYFEAMFNAKFAHALNNFFKFLYLPSILVVLAWVSGIYLEIFLDLENKLLFEVVFGFGLVAFISIVNIYKFKLGEFFQNFTTVIKLIPLIIIGVIGFFSPATQSVTTNHSINFMSVSLIAALLPIAFLFDGWSISTSISNKLEKPNKAMKYALSFTPLIILFVYVLYFVGITNFLGVDKVLELGNGAVFEAGNRIFGAISGKWISFIILLSIIGGVNGVTIGFIQSNNITKENSKSYSKFLIVVGWFIVHYVVMQFNLLNNSDISEISVVFSYLVYTILFIKQLILLYSQKQIGYAIITFISILLNLALVLASFVVSLNYTTLFFALCIIVVATSYFVESR